MEKNYKYSRDDLIQMLEAFIGGLESGFGSSLWTPGNLRSWVRGRLSGARLILAWLQEEQEEDR